MGKYLQVRVSAQTLDPASVEKAWPILFHLAYPPANEYAPAKKGVLELIDTLTARLSAGEIPEAVAARLSQGLATARQQREDLEQALAAWEPGKARELTDRIEETLDDLEDRAGYA